MNLMNSRSLNKYGNLSNSNLEAINFCNCIIMPNPEYETYTDIFTKKLKRYSLIIKLLFQLKKRIFQKLFRKNQTVLKKLLK